MSIELVKKYGTQVDELFFNESKVDLVTNQDYDFTGAHSVKVYKISTAKMNDYKRDPSVLDPSVDGISCYGSVANLNATTEEMLLKKDRSFIFNIDRLDEDETGQILDAETALARQIREVVVPEVDAYAYGVMATNAGTKAVAKELTRANIYDAILDGSEVLDDNKVPLTERCIVVSTKVYKELKASGVFDTTPVSEEVKAHGVVAYIDGNAVIKMPSSDLPKDFGFMIAHPSATTLPIKLEDYNVNTDTPIVSGTIVTGRICYDCFVLDNKAKGIYYQPIAPEAA